MNWLNEKVALETEEFVMEYLKTNHSTDIYDQQFHDDFHERFGGKRKEYMFGSSPVYKAQRVLTRIHKQGKIDRFRISLSGQESGFRNWVYSYTLPDGDKQ